MPLKSLSFSSFILVVLGLTLSCSNNDNTVVIPEDNTMFTIYADADYPDIPTTAIPSSAQRFVGGPNANDANNGSKDMPWATFNKALQELCASQTWYCLNLSGNLTVNAFIDTKFYGSGPSETAPTVYIRSAPHLANPATLTLNARVEIDGQENWLWYGFNISGTEGLNLGQDLPTNHHTFRNISGQMTGSGGDNHGFFQALNYNANYFGVFNCNLTGPGLKDVHGNTACIIFFGLSHARIENNRITNAPRPLYFKHSNRPTHGKAAIYIRHNYQHETQQGESAFISGRAQGGIFEISNNIFESPLEISNGGGGSQPEGHFISHNTFRSHLELENGNDPVLNATLKDNIILGDLELLRYGTHVNTTTSDFQLISGRIFYQSQIYTLAQWQQNAVPKDQDLNSLAGSPMFENTFTPPRNYSLAEESIGKGQASDGSDIGANVDRVGTK
jgi:hypothetical protein